MQRLKCLDRNTSVTEAKQGRERKIENEILIMGANLFGVLWVIARPFKSTEGNGKPLESFVLWSDLN